jgi:hypothetical protein
MYAILEPSLVHFGPCQFTEQVPFIMTGDKLRLSNPEDFNFPTGS